MNKKIQNYGNNQLAYDFYNEPAKSNNFVNYKQNDRSNLRSVSTSDNDVSLDIDLNDIYTNEKTSKNQNNQINNIDNNNISQNSNDNSYKDNLYRTSQSKYINSLDNNSVYSPVANSSHKIDNTYIPKNNDFEYANQGNFKQVANYDNAINEFIPSTNDYLETENKPYSKNNYDDYGYDNYDDYDDYNDYDDYDDYYEEEMYDDAEYQDYIDDKKAKKKKRRKKIIIATLSTLFVLLAGVSAYAYHYLHSFKTDEEKPDEKKMVVPEKKGFKTIALIGSDATGEGLADTIIITSINQDTGDVKMASVARDLYLKISNENGQDSYDKVNSSINDGGKFNPKRTVDTINENLGLSVDNYITVNFDSMAELVDAAGGIEVELPTTKNFVFTMNHFGWEAADAAGKDYEDVSEDLEGQKVKLNGYQALGYCRVRKSVESYKRTRPLGPEENDYTRSQRQKEVVNLIVQSIKSGGLGKIKDAADVMRNNNNFSTSMNIDDLIQLGKDAKERNYHLLEENGTISIPEELYSVKAPNTGNQLTDTQYPKPNLYEEARKIREFLYGEEDIDISKYQKVMEISDKLENIENKYGEAKFKLIKKCLDANNQPIPENTDWNLIKNPQANDDNNNDDNTDVNTNDASGNTTQNNTKQNNAKQNNTANKTNNATNKKQTAKKRNTR